MTPLQYPPLPPSPCPLNYFGRGENYVMPEDMALRIEMENKWEEWETAHPEDPDGSIYLDQYKELQKANPVFFKTPPPPIEFDEAPTKRGPGRPKAPETSLEATVRVVLYMECALREAFKDKCKDNKVSMSQAMTEFAKNYIS